MTNSDTETKEQQPTIARMDTHFELEFDEPQFDIQDNVLEGYARRMDQLAFTLGVVNVSLSSFILGAFPALYFRWHVVKFPVLMLFRFVTYKAMKYHYFMFDFCYFINFLSLFYFLVFYNNVMLFHVIFAFSVGPLSWAIPLWRNSLVFHSAEKITSVFIHASPGLAVWGVRWYSDQSSGFAICEDQGEDVRNCSASFYSLSIRPLSVYLLWQIFYWYTVYVRNASKVEQRDYKTSLNYLSESKGFIPKLINTFGPAYQKHTFVALQLAFTILTLLLAPVFFHSFYAHTCFLFTVLTWSAWNGSKYYIYVFSERYREQFELNQPKKEQ
eukprot:m.79291 g.79291  ORF g.79291 m.79291 type:complete len:328 (-) comp20841_c0_seq1:97-1080(-)